MTLIIDNKAVEDVLEPGKIVDALDLAARELAAGRAINSPPYRVLTPRNPADYNAAPGTEVAHHSFTSLSGAIAALNVTSDRIDSDIISYQRDERGGLRRVRIPGTRDRKSCGLVYLYSSITGEPLAIIQDGYLQKFRVAGTGAVGAKYLSRPHSRVLGLIGAGWQAEAAVMCLPVVRDVDQIKVYSPTPGKKEAFAEAWSPKAGVEIVPVASAEEAVAGANIVYTATNSPIPVVRAEWLERGQFVTGVTDLEVELAGWEKCDVMVANRHGERWKRYAIGGADVIPEGGMEYVKQETTIDWSSLPLLGDVASGAVPGRTTDDQLVGMLLRGDGVQFTATADYIFQACRNRGLGTEIDTDLFLQDESYKP